MNIRKPISMIRTIRGGSIFVKTTPNTVPASNYGVMIATMPVSILSSGFYVLINLMKTTTKAPAIVADFERGMASAAT